MLFSRVVASPLLAFATFILVLSAAVQALDTATLLKNGQEAQAKNILFQNLKQSDPCAGWCRTSSLNARLSQQHTAGDKACISGAVASCDAGTWDITRGRCAKSQNCFALPSTREVGTVSGTVVIEFSIE